MVSAVTEQQIKARLKPGWVFKQRWRGEQDNGQHVIDGELSVRGRKYQAAVRCGSLFATLYYNEKKVEI